MTNKKYIWMSTLFFLEKGIISISKKKKEKVKRGKIGSYFLNKFLENLFLKGENSRIFFPF